LKPCRSAGLSSIAVEYKIQNYFSVDLNSRFETNPRKKHEKIADILLIKVINH
jgi:hypothetical protein